MILQGYVNNEAEYREEFKELLVSFPECLDYIYIQPEEISGCWERKDDKYRTKEYWDYVEKSKSVWMQPAGLHKYDYCSKAWFQELPRYRKHLIETDTFAFERPSADQYKYITQQEIDDFYQNDEIECDGMESSREEHGAFEYIPKSPIA
jgi:hypothetical protein